MFTNNYMQLKLLQFRGANQTFTSTSGATFNGVVGAYYQYYADIGCWLTNVRISAPITVSDSGSSAKGAGIYLGTGTTPAKRTDYTIEAPITEGLTVSNASRTIGAVDDGIYAAVGTFALTNISDTDITITEIGVITFVPTSTGSSYTGQYCLMDRTVLDNPITIAVGETKTVSYKITFNHS